MRAVWNTLSRWMDELISEITYTSEEPFVVGPSEFTQPVDVVEETPAHAQAVIENIRIGQETFNEMNYLVIRSINPLAGIDIDVMTTHCIGDPEYGIDDIGAFLRWPIKDATLA